MEIIDLFSGVGGLSSGFVRQGCKVVVANEIDQDIARSYTLNHPHTKMINADITSIDIRKSFEKYCGKIDIVLGGPPCQGFSQKGNRKTINDERNFLFRYFCDVVRFIQPKYFVMENVPNILTAEKGFFKRELTALFEDMGYAVDCGILNASDYGVPQDRRRALFIGKKGVLPCSLPKSAGNKVTIWDAISDLAFLESGEGSEDQSYPFDPISEYQKSMRGGCNILHNHVSTAHSKDSIKKMSIIPPGSGKEILPRHMLTKSIYSGTWSRMIPDEQSVTITTRFDTPSSGRFMHPYLNRCITSREAARIQSFPDDFVFYGNKSSQMTQIGNAVPPLLSEAVARVIVQDACSQDSSFICERNKSIIQTQLGCDYQF